MVWTIIQFIIGLVIGLCIGYAEIKLRDFVDDIKERKNK